LQCLTPFATTDNVVWIFPAGPRKTISQHTDFDQTDAPLHAPAAVVGQPG
jgi:hypothetical protein